MARRKKPAAPTFSVDFDESVLDLDEIWPDGDGPENPTAADVLQVMKDTSSSATRIAIEWNLLSGLTVHGNHDGSRAEW